eukprot:408233-Pyramimonas_sp.AAC.6
MYSRAGGVPGGGRGRLHHRGDGRGGRGVQRGGADGARPASAQWEPLPGRADHGAGGVAKWRAWGGGGGGAPGRGGRAAGGGALPLLPGAPLRV